jgi:hypothetical protein
MGTIAGMKSVNRGSCVERLAALEHHFVEITKITKGLRRHLDEVAESVRIAVEDLSPTSGSTRSSKVRVAARRRPNVASRVGTARHVASGLH